VGKIFKLFRGGRKKTDDEIEKTSYFTFKKASYFSNMVIHTSVLLRMRFCNPGCRRNDCGPRASSQTPLRRLTTLPGSLTGFWGGPNKRDREKEKKENERNTENWLHGLGEEERRRGVGAPTLRH